MKLINKVITINNKTTSMRLSSAEWESVDIICNREKLKKTKLIELINSYKDDQLSLTYSVRLFSLIYLHNYFLKQKRPKYTEKQPYSSEPIFDAIKGIL